MDDTYEETRQRTLDALDAEERGQWSLTKLYNELQVIAGTIDDAHEREREAVELAVSRLSAVLDQATGASPRDEGEGGADAGAGAGSGAVSGMRTDLRAALE